MRMSKNEQKVLNKLQKSDGKRYCQKNSLYLQR